ncbi:hypothetical protein ABC347_16355 [Sphingomonas sp. 1P06PA]|uniref:hypothetical protein n=1 Tax=Sphingomonas sp. 1P06PA TaxID=554121 RepID=UPI0039A6E347
MDGDADDVLVWNGHILTGGQAYVLEEEDVETGPDEVTTQRWIGWADANGVKYVEGWFSSGDGSEESPYVDYATLTLIFPDQSSIMIHEFEDGDYGLSLSGPTPGQVEASSDPDLVGIPRFGTSHDGIVQGFDTWLAPEAIAALSTPGSYVVPEIVV